MSKLTRSIKMMDASAHGNEEALEGKILEIGCDAGWIARGRKMLQGRGFVVVTATTLRGALAACAAHRFDFIVVSRSVPLTVMQALRNRTDAGGPPVLSLSAAQI
jgi:DNA-binding response OmpR family regulator